MPAESLRIGSDMHCAGMGRWRAQAGGGGGWTGVVRCPARAKVHGACAWGGPGGEGNEARVAGSSGEGGGHGTTCDSTGSPPGAGMRQARGESGGGVELGHKQGAGDQGEGRASSGRTGSGAAGRQQGSSQGRSSGGAQRGVWVDPRADQLGDIAQRDPGAWAFGRL